MAQLMAWNGQARFEPHRTQLSKLRQRSITSKLPLGSQAHVTELSRSAMGMNECCKVVVCFLFFQCGISFTPQSGGLCLTLILFYIKSQVRWGESVKENTALKIKTNKILNPNRIDCDKHCAGGVIRHWKGCGVSSSWL